MANPVIAEITTYSIKQSTLTGGACREFWIRIPGLSAASDADAGTVMYQLLNPFKMDLVVVSTLVVITTLDAEDGDIDVGLGDDATGSNPGAELFDSIVNTAEGIFEGLGPRAVAGTATRPIWKAPGTSTDSYLTIKQNADVDASDLRWNLFIKVIPYDDLIGDEGTQAVVVVA